MSRNPSMLSQTPVQLVLGLFLGLAVILVAETASGNLHFGDGTRVHSTGDSTVVRINEDNDRLEIRLQGDVELLDDDSGVARIGAGSRLQVTQKTNGQRQRLEVTRGSDGQPAYTYWQGRKEAPFDASAKTWMRSAMLRFYRSSGVDSQRRVARMLAGGGAEAVFDEVAVITSDRVQRIYLGELIDQADEPAIVSRALSQAAREIGSSYETRHLLQRIETSHLADAEVRDAFRLAARSMRSSYEIRSLLIGLITEAETLSDELVETVLGVASKIESDHELAEVLIELAPRLPAAQPFPNQLDGLVDNLGSNHELRRVLTHYLDRIDLDQTAAGSDLDRLLDLGEGLHGSYERAELLVAVAESAPAGFTPPASYFRLVGGIDGDYERYRVLDSCLRIDRLTTATVAEIIDRAADLSSSHHRSELLIDLTSRQPMTSELAHQARQVAQAIGSDYERQRVVTAIDQAAIEATSPAINQPITVPVDDPNPEPPAVEAQATVEAQGSP